MSVWGSGGVPLFLQCDPPGFTEAELTLAVHGVPASGWTGGIDLYMNSESNGPADNAIPMMVQGPARDSTSGNMNLWVGGEYAAANRSCTLALWNDTQGSASGLTLFVGGSGVGDDYLPANNALLLSLWRAPAGAVPMFIAGPGEATASGVYFFLAGQQVATAGLTLSLPDVVGVAAGETKLYIHGAS